MNPFPTQHENSNAVSLLSGKDTLVVGSCESFMGGSYFPAPWAEVHNQPSSVDQCHNPTDKQSAPRVRMGAGETLSWKLQ